jgi:hypothetical protein
MSDFQERLRQALQRGQERQAAQQSQEESKAWGEEQLRRVHARIRLELSEHIEHALQQFAAQIPGFQCETIFGERGWGAACYRDDLRIAEDASGRGRRQNLYSRLEITVKPFSEYHVVDLCAKGTVVNRELFARRHYTPIPEADVDEFRKRIDAWILEFAELYATHA